MRGIVLLINFLATYLILVFIPVSFWILLKGDKKTWFRILLSGLIAFLVSTLIKDFYYLPRPFIISGQLPIIRYGLDGTMPSGHTAVSFAIALAIFTRYRKIGLILLFVSALIALGRIVGGVHSIIDVLVGLVVAQISFLLTKRFLRD